MGVKLTPELLYNKDFFQRWVDEVLHGDYDLADFIVQEAISVKNTYEDAEWPPVCAMQSIMFALCIIAAQTDLNTKAFEVFLRDQMALMYDCARFLIQHHQNEWDEVLKREEEYALVDAKGNPVNQIN